MIQHLQSGACRSGITKHTVDSFVSRYDTSHTFSYPQEASASRIEPARVIEELDSEAEEDSGEITPQSTISHSAVIMTPESTMSQPMCSNSQFLTPSSGSSPFFPTSATSVASSLDAQELSRRLSSFASKPPIYYCPDIPGIHGHSVLRTFGSLGALVQHLESRGCVGGRKKLRAVIGQTWGLRIGQ